MQDWLHRCCAGLTKTNFVTICDSDEPYFCANCKLANQSKEIAELKDMVTAVSLAFTELKSLVNEQM